MLYGKNVSIFGGVIISLFISAYPLQAQKLAFTIAGQEYPAVADTASSTVYCAVPAALLPAQVGLGQELAQTYVWETGEAMQELRECAQVYPLRPLGSGVTWNVAFTTLPIVSVSTLGQPIIADDDVPAKIEIYDADRHPGQPQRYDCLTHYRGSYSLNFEKKSLSINLIDSLTGDEENANLFDIRETDAWILDAMTVDVSRMRNRLCFDLWNAVSVCPWNGQRNGTKGQYVEVIRDGRYQGLYCFTDKVKRKTLGLKKTKDGAPDGLHGLLHKGLSGTFDEALCLLSYNDEPVDSIVWNRYELKYPNNTTGETVWQPLMRLIDFCGSDNTPEDFTARWQTMFYEDNFHDYALLLMTLNLIDNGMFNSYLAAYDYATDQRLLMIPWDMDGSFGRNPKGEKETHNRGWGQIDYLGPYIHMMKNSSSAFTAELSALWQRWKSDTFSTEAVDARIQAYADLFTESGAWSREYQRWKDIPEEESREALSLTPHDEAAYMRQWYREQVDYMDNLLSVAAGIGTPSMVKNPDTAVYDLHGRYLGAKADVWRHIAPGVYIVGGSKQVKLD